MSDKIKLNNPSIDINWIVKYRPTNLNTFICDDYIKGTYDTYSTQRNILIYSNEHGTGKTTLAKILTCMFGKFAPRVFNFDVEHYIAEDLFITKIVTICKAMPKYVMDADGSNLSQIQKVIILDDVNALSMKCQNKLLKIISTYSYGIKFIFTSNYIEEVNCQIKEQSLNIDLSHPNKEKIIKHLENILTMEDIELSGFDMQDFVDSRYPNIRSMIIDLQEMIMVGTPMKNISKKHMSNKYLEIWNLITKSKDWEKVKEYIYSSDVDMINNLRELNKYIWRHAVKESNIRLIQITSVNEDKFSRDGDNEVIFISSLIEMVK
jgi:DNA polymerase III delta prime subunit